MSEHHDHDHGSHDHGAHEHSDSGHLPGPVRSALGLLADGIDKARQVGDKVRDESTEIFDKVRDEGTQVVNKLRGHSSESAGAQSSTSSAGGHDRAAEALDIAKTVASALLVGSVKVVQLAMKEWQAHTGNASTPEDHAPAAADATSAWDTAGTPRAHDDSATADAAEPQPEPEVNNWDDVEAEVAGTDVWSQETDGAASASVGDVAADNVPGADAGAPSGTEFGGTAAGDPVAGATIDEADLDEVVYTSESDIAPASAGDAPSDDDQGPALRAESEPAHHGHAADAPSGGSPAGNATGETPPLEGFDDMTIGSLRGRLGSLDQGQLEALRDYERRNAGRPQVLTMLENRIAKLSAQHGDA